MRTNKTSHWSKGLPIVINQAEQMLARNKKLISSFKVGDVCLAKMNNVDLGSADAPKIVCIILEKVDDKMFRLGHISGTIAEYFPFHVLTKIDNSVFNLKIEDISDKEVTLREAIRSVSIANGQGFKACNCVTGTCRKDTRCTCFKKVV